MSHSLIQFSSSFLIIFPPTLSYLSLSLHLAEFFLCPSFYFSGYLYFHFSLPPLYSPLSSFSSSTQPIWFDVWYFLFHLAQTNKAKAERERIKEKERSRKQSFLSYASLSLTTPLLFPLPLFLIQLLLFPHPSPPSPPGLVWIKTGGESNWFNEYIFVSLQSEISLNFPCLSLFLL